MLSAFMLTTFFLDLLHYEHSNFKRLGLILNKK